MSEVGGNDPYRLLAGEGADQFAAAGAFEPYPQFAPSGDSLDFSSKEEDTVGRWAAGPGR